jgi:drug/metabolite transporter (DMT)-like permease
MTALSHRGLAAGLTAGLGAAAIWGAMFVVSKAVLPVVPPFTLLTFRLVLGALALGAVVLVNRFRPAATARARTPFKTWLAVLAAGLVGYGVSLGFQFAGTALGTASNASLVTCATPAFVSVFAAPLLGERLGGRAWLALALATAGVLAVLAPELATFDTANVANLLLVGAALTWALYTVLTAKAARGTDLVLASLVGFLGGLPVSVPGMVLELSAHPLGVLDGGIIAGILFLGLVSTALAMLLWNYAFQTLPASAAGLTFFAQPVTGTLLATLFLGEAPPPLFYAGAALIAGALFVGRKI